MIADQELLLTAADVAIVAAEGHRLPRVSILAYSGDVMTVPGFGPIVLDLKGMTLAAEIPLLADHANSIGSIVGQGTPEVRAGQLFVDGTANVTTEAARQVVDLAKSGHKFQASVGATPLESRRITAGETIQANGRTIKAATPFLFVTKSRLREVTICALGCDAATSVSIAAKKESTMTTATIDANDILAAERQRVSEINAAFDGLEFLCDMKDRADKLRSEAINGGMAVADIQAKLLKIQRDDIQLYRIRAERPQMGSMVRASQQDGSSAQHIAAALMVKAGFESAAAKSFGEHIMEQSRQLHGQSLPDLCRAALMIDGRDIPPTRDAMIRASLSTGSMPVALGDSANKVLVEAYRQAPASWRSFATVKPAANFKTQTGIRPTFAGDLEELPPGGLIKHGTFGEETYSWSVDTFAKQFGIDRRDIVNDDASVFSDVLPGLARAAARTLNKLVATTLLANAGTFFGSGNANYFEGALTNLSASSLATAIKMLRQMKDAEGNLLDLEPAVLLIPPELEQTALALLNSTEVARVSTGDQLPTGNTFKDIAQLAVEPRLSDSAFTGYSAVAWYLFSNAMNAAVVVGFLDGMQTPTLETFGLDADINRLSFGFRVYFDFGCALGDFRAAIRSKGKA